jgi:hypothetical protein
MTSTPRRPRASGEQAARTGKVVAFPVATAEAAPRVRWSRVMNAQARIASGWYERPEVTERLLDALEQELATES